MTRSALAGWLLVVATAAAPTAPCAQPIAAGDATGGDPGGDRFRAASQRRIGGDPRGAVGDFARLADELPASPWADDARMEAALVAEQLGDFGQARLQLERLIADHPDSRLVRRAQARLAAIVAAVGAGGEWSAVAADHDAILRAAAAADDPTPSIEQLEALVAAHPGYPRSHDARMWIGDSWLRQGDWQRALRWYRDAASHAADAGARFQAVKATADAMVSHDQLDAAAALYRTLRTAPGADLRALDEAELDLDQARTRARRRQLAWLVLALLAVLATAVMRRDAGSWRAAGRALLRPPLEVLYFAPVAALMVVGGRSGNRIVAHAVTWIAAVGLIVAWTSGVSLELARRRGPLSAARIAGHVLAAALAVAAVAYLAVMKDRLLDMLIETWRHGHDSG